MCDRSSEAVTLVNIGVLFQIRNKATEVIANLEKSLQISLEIRQDLQKIKYLKLFVDL